MDTPQRTPPSPEASGPPPHPKKARINPLLLGLLAGTALTALTMTTASMVFHQVPVRLGREMDEALAAISRLSLDAPDEAGLKDEMLSALISQHAKAHGDRYSRYLTAAQFAEDRKASSGEDAAEGEGVAASVITRGKTRVGYLRVSSMYVDDINARVDRAQAWLVSQGAAQWILDLRGDRGGFIDVGPHIADGWLQQGVIYRRAERGGKITETHEASKQASDLQGPLAVLVDAHTASSAEIAAAALQELGRGRLVGKSTRGKGRIQSYQTLSGGGELILTSARWLTPRGEDIQGKGIVPDVEVADTRSAAQQSAIPLHGPQVARGVAQADPSPAQDAQLARAIDLLSEKE